MRRVAAVTGGARGIGLGICRRLALEHYDLALCGVREAGAAEGSLEGLRRMGADAVYVQADIGVGADRAKFIETIRDRYGALHVLVNNAGIAPPRRADILEADAESFDEVMRVNLRGTYFLTQMAAQWMVDQVETHPTYEGCIVNITSFSATVASTDRGDYCIAKAGLAMASQLWAVRLAEFGISVYEVRPGIIKTDMTSRVRAKYDMVIAGGGVLQARWGLPDDVGRAVAMLARGELGYSTGQVVLVDGGFGLRRI